MSNKRKSISTKHKDIFNYWKDKCIDSKGNVFVDYGYEGCTLDELKVEDTKPVITDWGEPQCFCCGNPISQVLKENEYEELVKNGIDDIWELKEVKSELQKCHIIADSLGGEDKPENLFLMCRRCHRDSPDTIYKSLFLKWVYDNKDIQHFNKAADIARKEYYIHEPFINANRIKKLKKNLTQHGAVVVTSTITTALLGAIIETDQDKLLKEEIAKDNGENEINKILEMCD